MSEERLFEKYRRRLMRIGLQKSFLWAVAVGFLIEFVAAFVIWFFHWSVLVSVLVMLAALAISTLLATVVIYNLFYRPTRARVARMIDRLGLEERFVTMCEHEGDSSSIANIQREDAKKRLETASEKRFFFRLSKAGAICLCVSIVFGLTMGILSAVSAGGLIPSANEIFTGKPDEEDKNSEDEGENSCIIVYVAGEGGTLGGQTVQRLQKGEDTTPVTALPDMGYEFAGWSDGDPRATRVDYNVQTSMTLTAMFVKKAEVELPEVPGGGGSGEGGRRQHGRRGTRRRLGRQRQQRRDGRRRRQRRFGRRRGRNEG